MNMKEYKESYLLNMNDVMDLLIDYNVGKFEREYIDEGIGSIVAQLTYLRYIHNSVYISFDSYECRFIDMIEKESDSELLNRLKDLSIKNYRPTF